MRSPCGTRAAPTMTRSSASMIGANAVAVTLFLHQGAGRIGGPERLVARNVGDDLVVIPRRLRLLRRLHLHEQEIVHHQAILAQRAVAGEEDHDCISVYTRSYLRKGVCE